MRTSLDFICYSPRFNDHLRLTQINNYNMKKERNISMSSSQIIESNLKRPEFDWIVSFVNQFRANVEEPITLRQTLMRNLDSQRCLTHSILYSIYCTVCRKVLCASCMYSTTLHRKHRVIPVDNATDEIRDDLKTFQGKIPKILERCSGIVNSNSDYLVKVQRQYTPIIIRVQQFYESLRAFLKAKQKEQLAELRQLKEEVRAEITCYNKELSRMQQFMGEKFKAYCFSNIKKQILIPSRNILENLIQASSFIKEPHFDTDKSRFNTDPQRIKAVLQEVTYKISHLVSSPVLHRAVSSKKPNISTRSVDTKSKTASFTVLNKQQESGQAKKRTNSSVAGARTAKRL